MNFFDNIFDNSNFKYVTGLNNEMKSLFIYNKFLNKKTSILVVSSTLFEANMIYKSISNYTNDVLFFPMDNFLTSEALAKSPELQNNRVETLNELINNNKKIIITNLMGVLKYLPPKNIYSNHILKIDRNNEYKINELVEKLYSMGYERNVIVEKTGEIAVRGYVLDIFPVSSQNPIRLEFWGDNLESIREFNVENQLKIKELEKIEIEPISDDIFSDTKTNIINYLEDDFITIFNEYGQIKESYKQLQLEILEYQNDQNQIKKYMFNLDEIKFKNEIYLSNFDNYNSVSNTINYKTYDIEPFSSNLISLNNKLNDYIENKNTVIICLINKYQINKIMDNIKNDNFVITNEKEIFENKINLIIKSIENGFIFNKYVIISDSEIFNHKINKNKYKNNFKYGIKIRNIDKLKIGDYVVHNIHGIGKYLGIKTLEKNKLKKDYLIIEYRDKDKLYIPVEKIELISKYSANDDIKPKLNKLGSTEWIKTKKKVRDKLENIAGELLKLYAKREASEGFSFKKDDELQYQFEKEFTYEETLDQLKVIDEIKNDMESNHPMDRLLCGDVGYGKTEVAFRAMFKAVLSKKQVAYLCPTTILSNQHYNNAIARFKSFPIEIVCLNRFVSQKKVKEILKGLKNGKIDIVIGTHRLLSDDVIFKDLGLLVIDEEQRFGVKHKEKIKQIRNNIDVLSLSATPIPRTLQMSMVGIKNLSLIETAPINRYPVQTYVLEENNTILKDAIYKELSRDGQVFILYNHVDSIEEKANEIANMIKDARVTFVHGQMNKIELENIINDFINKEYDILLCTTIIETGIDIPNVNTLILMDADRFGLSQLYQIRGRVGRGNVIAYCYLMYKKGKVLSEIAEKRLKAIKEFTKLGSGFSIAMRDLSIRGAGDILGSEQAGFIDSIGIDLYLKMLNEEVEKLKGNKVIEEEQDEKPLIDVSTTISDDYVTEEELKIEIHKMINDITDENKFNKIKNELEDRFGNINENIKIYMYEQLFENQAKNFEIEKIRQTNNFIEITLSENYSNKLNGEQLFMELTELTRMYRLKFQFKKLIITLDIVKLDKHYIFYLLDLLKILKKCEKEKNSET